MGRQERSAGPPRLVFRKGVLADVVLGIEAAIDVQPLAHAPMIQLRRLAVGRHRTRIADAVLVGVRRDVRHFLPLARGQAESDLSAPRLYGELTNMAGRSAKEGDRLPDLRLSREDLRAQQAEPAGEKQSFHGFVLLTSRSSSLLRDLL